MVLMVLVLIHTFILIGFIVWYQREIPRKRYAAFINRDPSLGELDNVDLKSLIQARAESDPGYLQELDREAGLERADTIMKIVFRIGYVLIVLAVLQMAYFVISTTIAMQAR